MIKRLLLGVLLVGLATLTIPPLRHRADPHLQSFRFWLGEKLDGPLAPVLAPYREIKAKTDLGNFVARMTSERNQGRPAPQPNNFTSFLVSRKLSDDGTDPWGVPYVVERQRDSLYVVSAGRDMNYGTADDLRQGLRYAAPRGGVRRR